VEPEAGEQATGTGPLTSSLAVTVKLTTAQLTLVAAAARLAARLPGVVMTGGVLSRS